MSTQTSRREFLEAAGVVAAGACLSMSTPLAAEDRPAQVIPKKASAVNQNDLPIVDTHQHLWDLTKFKLPWLKGDAVQKINRSFLMSDYLKLIGSHKVVKTVYMEVNVDPMQQAAEAEYVLDLCRRDDNPMVGAIIGGSPQSSDFAKYMQPYAENRRVNGVRTVLHDPDRPKGMCLEPMFVDNIKRLGDMDKSFDLCMRPGEILDGAKLADLCPKTRLVVDHCGNMPVQSEDKALREAWMNGMKETAARPQTFCKISGIIVTAKPNAWKPQDLAANIHFCLDTFGIDRCFFGGDWPVCTLTAPLAEWIDALKQIVKDKSFDDQKKLFHDNAVRVYKLQAK
ncbi:MAG TPA: amidohydrolase family protein [Planctomycetaceae bacterium]|nr:amidohydrolase family protein [Planctomycetaceae bacterium]